MYTTRNFRTKKALKEAVERKETVTVYQPGFFSPNVGPQNGVVSLEGPHFPEPHKWHATATLKDGVVVVVR